MALAEKEDKKNSQNINLNLKPQLDYLK